MPSRPLPIRRDDVRPDDPLRLQVAAALAYPDGSMTAAGLRRENARGRLVIERVAGKDYVTLAAIERMREICRLEAKVPDYGSDPSVKMPPEPSVTQCGLSAMQDTISPRAALHTTLAGLSGRSPHTSQRSTPKPLRENATVTPLRSQ